MVKICPTFRKRPYFDSCINKVIHWRWFLSQRVFEKVVFKMRSPKTCSVIEPWRKGTDSRSWESVSDQVPVFACCVRRCCVISYCSLSPPDVRFYNLYFHHPMIYPSPEQCFDFLYVFKYILCSLKLILLQLNTQINALTHSSTNFVLLIFKTRSVIGYRRKL